MKTICSLLSLTLIISLIGCGSPAPSAVDVLANESSAEKQDHDEHGHDDHDGHDHDTDGHPESFGEAVDQIKEMGEKITAAFISGKPDDAHHELHEIGHMIQCLPELAKKADLSSEQQDSIGKVTEALMDAFGELDGTLHGGGAVDANDVSEVVSAQIEKLQSMRK